MVFKTKKITVKITKKIHDTFGHYFSFSPILDLKMEKKNKKSTKKELKRAKKS